MRNCRNQGAFEDSFLPLREDLISENRLWEQSDNYHHQLDLIDDIVLPNLTFRQRCYFFLVQIGYKDSEIAQVLHISRSGVSNLRLRTIRKARKILRKKKLIPISFVDSTK